MPGGWTPPADDPAGAASNAMTRVRFRSEGAEELERWFFPGQSITIQPRLYHDFEEEPGTGPVLLGEVSQCNDDNTDNRFNPPVGRFPAIEEDEPPYRLLCNEYPPAR